MNAPDSRHPGHDDENPYAPPSADAGKKFGIDDPIAVSRRQELATAESYLKALGRYHLLLGILFVIFILVQVWQAVLHSQGKVSAPWVGTPLWICQMVATTVFTVSCFAVFPLFWMLKRTALAVEAAVVTAWATLLLMGLGRYTVPGMRANVLSILMTLLTYVIMIFPLVKLIDLRNSPVFSREYAEVVARTPHIRVKPKLPIRLKLYMLLLILVFTVLAPVARR